MKIQVNTDKNRVMFVFNLFFSGKGADRHPCGQSFHGPNAFSEPETRAVRSLLLSLKPTPVFVLSLHSAVGALMYGYGHQADVWPINRYETVRKSVI